MRLFSGSVTGIAVLVHWLFLSAPVCAQTSSGPHNHTHANKPSAQRSGSEVLWINGEVRKVDLAKSTILLRHEAVKALNMPAMTMVFNVRSPALLKGLMDGEFIRFTLAQQGGRTVVSDIKRDICE